MAVIFSSAGAIYLLGKKRKKKRKLLNKNIKKKIKKLLKHKKV
jgi:hypothetical protein